MINKVPCTVKSAKSQGEQIFITVVSVTCVQKCTITIVTCFKYVFAAKITSTSFYFLCMEHSCAYLSFHLSLL
jgi:hypothetical protein